MDKAGLRKFVLDERKKLEKCDLTEKSSRIFNQLVNLEQFHLSQIVMCYMDFRNEVETGDFINLCLKSGRKVILPRILKQEGNGSRMAVFEIRNPEVELKKRCFWNSRAIG